MKNLTEFEKGFLNASKSRVIAEIPMFKDFQSLTYRTLYGNANEAELSNYRKIFILNAFMQLTGSLFFVSRSVFDLPVEDLRDEYIKFCKIYGESYTV